MDLVITESDPRPYDIAFTKNFIPQDDCRFYLDDIDAKQYQLCLGSADLPSSCWFLIETP